MVFLTQFDPKCTCSKIAQKRRFQSFHPVHQCCMDVSFNQGIAKIYLRKARNATDKKIHLNFGEGATPTQVARVVGSTLPVPPLLCRVFPAQNLLPCWCCVSWLRAASSSSNDVLRVLVVFPTQRLVLGHKLALGIPRSFDLVCVYDRCRSCCSFCFFLGIDQPVGRRRLSFRADVYFLSFSTWFDPDHVHRGDRRGW